MVLRRMATSWRRASKVGVLVKDSEPCRVRGDVRVTAVLDETDDALVSDGPLSIRMETLSRRVRRLLGQMPAPFGPPRRPFVAQLTLLDESLTTGLRF